MVEIMVLHRLINPKTVTAAQLTKALAEFLLDRGDAAAGIHFIVSYEPEFLKLARRYKKRAEHRFAVLHYAMWYETFLGNTLYYLTSRAIPTANCELLLRELSAPSKIKYIEHQLRHPLPDHAKKLFSEVLRLRNAFAHFRALSPRADAELSAEYEKASLAADQAVKSLVAWERKVLLDDFNPSHLFRRLGLVVNRDGTMRKRARKGVG
ncbi:MAG: hypothetical protein WD716_10765 [Fimbriimonadaceae bacterium]